ncbi:esterase/lipase family protein [Dyella acidiphila]|uniref:Alpha/beta hydrolase n=1 Tax=Dyella acidiphila TaxID=2775866 RepID=A0ABR9G794_9GAMM|nr:alpha/beta hydrolase [Dyella acidiphila]MBE1159917.1 alpha/beta hydrolase [Dyella acidiphila]
MALYPWRNSWFVRSMFLMCVMLAIAGCPTSTPGQQHGSAAQSGEPDPHWVYQGAQHAPVAVVFIHGIFGDTDGTWTNAEGKTLFQFLKETPNVGDKVDIYAFGYASHMFKDGSLNIDSAANVLDKTLEYDGVWKYKSVVFVVHSMGGLVALREIIGNQNRMAQVPLMFFYAVPQEGAQIANIAHLVMNNPALRQMLPADGNAFLQQLSGDWNSIPFDKRPTIICAFEDVPVAKILIVPWSSATRFCSERPAEIAGANHITITKPDSARSFAVMALVDALNKYVLTPDDNLAMPDFTREGDHWVYVLSDPNGKKAARLTNNGYRGLPYSVNVSSDSDLIVWPGEGDIPAQHTDQLGLAITQGNLQKEYSFVLSVPAMGDQKVVVRLSSIEAVKAQQDALAKTVASSLSTYLSSSANVDALSQNDKAQALASIAAVAEKAVSEQSPDLPEGVKWVLAADTLASMGISGSAAQALSQAALVSPSLNKTPVVLRLAGQISAQAGKQYVLSNGEPINTGLDVQHLDVNHPSPVAGSNLAAWSSLSKNMQNVPVLKAYGLSMQGDVLQAKGHNGAAIEAYKASVKLEYSPLTTKKLDALQIHGATGGL